MEVTRAGEASGRRECAALRGGTVPGGRFSANAARRLGAILAFNLLALTAWWPPGEDLARAGWKRIPQILLIRAGRPVERGRRLVLKLRIAGTEELQVALERRVAQPVAPG